MFRALFLQFESACFSLLRAGLRMLARPLTLRDLPGPWLVIAPHPDDETLGCGGAILQARQAGIDVRLVLVTDGRHATPSAKITPAQLATLRREEMLVAAARLGIAADRIDFVGFEDGTTTAQSARLEQVLGELIARLQPQSIFSPSGADRHSDHRAIAATIGKLHAAGQIHGKLCEYPVWFWSFKTWLLAPKQILHLLTGRFALRRLDARSQLDSKRQALAAHRSQMENLTGESDWQILTPYFIRHFFDGSELFFVRCQEQRP